MDERQQKIMEASFYMNLFMESIRKKAHSWLGREIYPSQEYQVLKSKLQPQDLEQADQVLRLATTDLGLMEHLRSGLVPHKGILEEKLKPLEGSKLWYPRARMLLEWWDTEKNPTDFFKFVQDQQKKANEEELKRDPSTTGNFKRSIKRANDIENSTLPILINKYNKYKGLRVILIGEN